MSLCVACEVEQQEVYRKHNNGHWLVWNATTMQHYISPIRIYNKQCRCLEQGSVVLKYMYIN